jgi:hypothetical protein
LPSAKPFEAVAATLPLGSLGYENQTNERGERLIWLDHAMVSKAECAGAASYTEVIRRIASESVV